jgi:hypothetical protein
MTMRRREFIRLLVGATAACSVAAQAQQFVGAWRATNECFLAAFVLIEGGRAQTAYLSGERDDNAVWTWDGSTLRITSATFPLDRFTGHLANDRIEVDYVWHDLDKDQFNSQTCVFERFAPPGRGAGRLPFTKHAANSREVIE